jgi:hypothetical protein
MAKKFVIESINPSNEGKTNVIKLVSETTVDLGILGKKLQKQTYYMGAMQDVQAKEGDEVKLDMDLFNVTEREFTPDDSDEVMLLKWLSVK